MLSSFFVVGGPAAGGWTSYATLTAKAQYTGVEWGQHLWIIALMINGVSSLMGAVNYITTIVNMRAPGMGYFRMPLTVWSLFITAILLLLALPVLTAALAMLLFDRTMARAFSCRRAEASRCSGSICSGSSVTRRFMSWFCRRWA